MTHTNVIGMLNTLLLKVPRLSNMDVHAAEDDSKSDMWYIVLYSKGGPAFMHKYMGASGKISANFLMDPNISSPDCEALITVNDQNGNITMHHVGHGKLHLPGIVNSSGMSYGEVDFQLAINQYVQRYSPVTTSTAKLSTGIEHIEVSLVIKSSCDCGGHKLGYRDDELHGHARWCELVRRSGSGYVGHGNGD